jgi:hypothetical protein
VTVGQQPGPESASSNRTAPRHGRALPRRRPWKRRLPWFAALLALAPFLLWHAQFAELFWFGDDFSLVDGLAQSGLWRWIFEFFTESCMSVFKLAWGGALFAFGGSYTAMIGLLWLTHAANTWLLGRLLLRAGFPWIAALFTQLIFALTPGNIETLGWSIQWSALLATFFLLVALLWLENRTEAAPAWSCRVHVPLSLFAAASACSFARGVLTGGVLAVAIVLPAAFAHDWRSTLRRLPAATVCLLPSVALTCAILAVPQGNQHALGGHAFEIARFAATFLFLSPWHQLLGIQEITPASAVLVAALKIALVIGGLFVARGRVRVLLVSLLAYDVSNALLLGIGRYHTGVGNGLGAPLPLQLTARRAAVRRSATRTLRRPFRPSRPATPHRRHCGAGAAFVAPALRMAGRARAVRRLARHRDASAHASATHQRSDGDRARARLHAHRARQGASTRLRPALTVRIGFPATRTAVGTTQSRHQQSRPRRTRTRRARTPETWARRTRAGRSRPAP